MNSKITSAQRVFFLRIFNWYFTFCQQKKKRKRTVSNMFRRVTKNGDFISRPRFLAVKAVSRGESAVS